MYFIVFVFCTNERINVIAELKSTACKFGTIKLTDYDPTISVLVNPAITWSKYTALRLSEHCLPACDITTVNSPRMTLRPGKKIAAQNADVSYRDQCEQ